VTVVKVALRRVGGTVAAGMRQWNWPPCVCTPSAGIADVGMIGGL
jgi:hypothetical protein